MDFKPDECVLCRSEAFLNPTMRLIPADCNHNYCETCINRTFMSKASIQCVVCKKTLKRQNFQAKAEDVDPEFEREMAIRKSILKDYNKRREDFPNLKQYNDYLEEVEDIIYNLCNNIDVEKTNEKIKQYKKENSEYIIINQQKKEEDDRKFEARLRAEEQEAEERKRRFLAEDTKQLQETLRERQEMIERMSKGLPPTEPKKEATAPKFVYAPKPAAAPVAAAPAPAAPVSLLPQPMEIEKTSTGLSDEELKEKQKKAAGWTDDFITRRALEEAMASLFVM